MKSKKTKAIMPLNIGPWMTSSHTGYVRKITFWDICNDTEVMTWHYEDMRNAPQWEFLDELDLQIETVLIEGEFKYKAKKSKTDNLPILNMDSKVFGYKVLDLNVAYSLVEHRPSMHGMETEEYEYTIDTYSHSKKYRY